MASERKNCWLLLILGFILFIPWLGDKRFYTRGEAREALAIQSVFDQGSWIVPYGYGGVVASKPPLLHWTASLLSIPSGEVTELTSRLPSAMSSIIFISIWFAFLFPRAGFRQAILSSFILLTSLEWFRLSGTTRVDMIHSVFLVGALISLYQFIVEEKRLTFLTAVLCLVASVLSKGPVGIIIPSIVTGLFLLSRNLLKRNILPVLGIFILAVAISSLWYWKAFTVGGEGFSKVVLSENLARFTGSIEGDPHRASVFYLWGSLLVGFIPWSLLLLPEWIINRLIPAIKDQKRELHILAAGEGVKGHLQRVFSLLFTKLKAGISYLVESASPLKAFAIIAAICIIGFYSIPSGKRSVYLLPAYPFLSWLISIYLLHLDALRHRFFGKMVVGFAALVLVVFFVGFSVAMAAPLLSSHPMIGGNPLWGFFGDMVRRGLTGISLLQSLLFVGPLLIAGWILVKWSQSFRRSFIPFAFYLFYSVFLSVQAVIAPLYANAISPEGFAKSINRAMEEHKIPHNASIYSFSYEFYGVSFYSRLPIKTKKDGFQLGDYIILYEKDLSNLSEKLASTTNDSLRWEVVLRSQRSIESPLEFVTLVKLIEKEAING